MNATLQRDHASRLAKTDPGKALEMARKIKDPRLRAQALAWVARYMDAARNACLSAFALVEICHSSTLTPQSVASVVLPKIRKGKRR